jgi:hypothetical protein
VLLCLTFSGIIGGVLCGLFWLGIIIAGAVLLSSYLAGRPKELPNDTFICTGDSCYTAAELDAINEPWNAVLSTHVAPGVINGISLTAVCATSPHPPSHHTTALRELLFFYRTNLASYF